MADIQCAADLAEDPAAEPRGQCLLAGTPRTALPSGGSLGLRVGGLIAEAREVARSRHAPADQVPNGEAPGDGVVGVAVVMARGLGEEATSV